MSAIVDPDIGSAAVAGGLRSKSAFEDPIPAGNLLDRSRAGIAWAGGILRALRRQAGVLLKVAIDIDDRIDQVLPGYRDYCHLKYI
jgi:hypothetical protein